MKSVHSRHSRHSQKIVAILTIAGLLESTAHAMPAFNSSTSVSKIDAEARANDPVLNTASIFGDHLDQNRIYVSPSHKKTQTGVFSIVGQPACDILKNQYAMTYLIPGTPPEQWYDSAVKGPVSPYFDFFYGNYISNRVLINELRDKIVNIEDLRQENLSVVSEYEAALAFAESKGKEKDSAQAEYDKYHQRIKDLTNALIASASNPELLASYNVQIEATRNEFAEQAPRLVTAINESSKAFAEANTKLAEAQGKYKAAIPDEDKLVKRIDTLNVIFDTIQKSAKTVYDENNSLLSTLESGAVGTASASYSIWSDEVSRLQQIVNNSGQALTAYPLPIFNIRMNAVQKLESPSSIKSDNSVVSTTLNNANSLAIVNNSALPVADGVSTNITSFEASGKQVEHQAATLSGNGASTFTNIISRGAYCTGDSERKFEAKKPSNPEENGDIFELQHASYRPRTAPVLAQSVSLSYNYNLKNDPIDVSCEMDIYKFSSWTSKKKSSGFLFWRKKKSSEDRRMIQENGITCKNNINDFGAGSAERSEAIIDAMTQEIGAEYILQYAKSYEIKAYKEADLPNPGAAAEKMGTAMQALCGGNVYCEVGSIILKTGNELFGSASGSSSGSETISGKISRRYNEHSYTTLPGDAVIDLTVDL